MAAIATTLPADREKASRDFLLEEKLRLERAIDGYFKEIEKCQEVLTTIYKNLGESVPLQYQWYGDTY